MPMVNFNSASKHQSLWDFLALPDEELEKADIVAMNLSVAVEISSLKHLDISGYVQVVNKWTQQFSKWLAVVEREEFRKAPENWGNDIRFFRIGMLQQFLDQGLGIRYNEEQKIGPVFYENPGDLFLHGLIDRRIGTCGTMPTLHVAMARRMGWPVSLACASSHQYSRFDDGEVTYNIDSTNTRGGGFCSEGDSYYVKDFGVSKKAIECGSDLRSLTAREMMAIFIGFRGRHHHDIDKQDLADVDYSLARALFPTHRKSYMGQMQPFVERGEKIFDPNEEGHPAVFLTKLQKWLDVRQNYLPMIYGGMKVVPVPQKPKKPETSITKNILVNFGKNG